MNEESKVTLSQVPIVYLRAYALKNDLPCGDDVSKEQLVSEILEADPDAVQDLTRFVSKFELECREDRLLDAAKEFASKAFFEKL